MTSKHAAKWDSRRVAVHEAGHVVAAVQLGIPVVGATIDRRAPRFIRDGFRRSRNLALEHLILISLAGGAAEQMVYGNIANDGDKLDLAQAKAFIADAYPNAFFHCYHLSRMRSAAENLVSTDWARVRIERLADALIEQTTLDADEIYALTASEIRPAAPHEYGGAIHVIGGQSPR